MGKKRYEIGDLVRVPHLPRKRGDSNVWRPDTRGPHLGMVINDNQKCNLHSALIGQYLVVKLSTGELVKLSSNLVEALD